MGKRRRISSYQASHRQIQGMRGLLSIYAQHLRKKRLEVERAAKEEARQKKQADRAQKQFDKENQKFYFESRMEESIDA